MITITASKYEYTTQQIRTTVFYDRASQLYIWEACWDELFELFRQNVTLLYKEQILIFLARNMGRTHYQEACRYIRRMMKLGGRQAAVNLIDEIRSMYRTRRALLEELDKI